MKDGRVQETKATRGSLGTTQKGNKSRITAMKIFKKHWKKELSS